VKAIEASRTTATLTTMEIIKAGISQQLQQIAEQSRKMGKTNQEIFKDIKMAFPTSLDTVDYYKKRKFISDSEMISVGGSSTPITDYPAYIQEKTKILEKIGEEAYSLLKNDEKESILLRMILEKGPKSKVEVDQLPKGALGQIKGIDAVLDSWAEPIGTKVEINPDTLRASISVKSRNATLSK